MPDPGFDAMANVPPRRRTRSSIPRIPRPRVFFGSKPWPSSDNTDQNFVRRLLHRDSGIAGRAMTRRVIERFLNQAVNADPVLVRNLFRNVAGLNLHFLFHCGARPRCLLTPARRFKPDNDRAWKGAGVRPDRARFGPWLSAIDLILSTCPLIAGESEGIDAANLPTSTSKAPTGLSDLVVKLTEIDPPPRSPGHRAAARTMPRIRRGSARVP